MKREEFQYTSCFCEENIYLLCQRLASSSKESSPLYAVFISNPSKSVAFWKHDGMRSEKRENRPVVWDYHVILLGNTDNDSEHGWVVFDFDSSLEPFPTPLLKYLDETFCPKTSVPCN